MKRYEFPRKFLFSEIIMNTINSKWDENQYRHIGPLGVEVFLTPEQVKIITAAGIPLREL